MKKVVKSILTYGAALILGAALTLLVRPYARAHRADPSLIGGEILMPAYTVAAAAVVRGLKKGREEA